MTLYTAFRPYQTEGCDLLLDNKYVSCKQAPIIAEGLTREPGYKLPEKCAECGLRPLPLTAAPAILAKKLKPDTSQNPSPHSIYRVDINIAKFYFTPQGAKEGVLEGFMIDPTKWKK